MADLQFPYSARSWTPNDLSRSSATDYVLDQSSVVFSALRNMGSMTGVPYLGDAASIALRILNLVKAVRNNSDAYMELAKDVCGLVYTILVECQEMERNRQTIPQRVQTHIQGLVRNLKEIESFAEKKLKRNGIQKLINHTRDIDQIQRYRDQLRQSLDIFAIQTNISVQQNLQHLVINVEQQREELKTDRLRQEERERIGKEEQRIQREEVRAALLRKARQDSLANNQQQEAHREELEAKRRRQEERERKAKEDRATRMEILRIQEEDLRQEELEIERAIQEENRKNAAKAKNLRRAKSNEERLRQEGDELRRQQAAQSQQTYAQPPNGSPYLSPAPYLSPYGYTSYSISAPYLVAPPSPTPAYGSISLNNINNSAISFGNSSVVNHNYLHNNSGNITTTTISNSFNR